MTTSMTTSKQQTGGNGHHSQPVKATPIDPFPYGWRTVMEVQPSGCTVMEVQPSGCTVMEVQPDGSTRRNCRSRSHATT